jgi:CheY-like chemotaxis protein
MERALARILVVDDDEAVLEIAATALANVGHRVVCAHNAAEALKLLETEDAFDALFTDVRMPGGINGFELARRAKAARPALKILYATGYSGLLADRSGETFGPILGKPYRPSELAEEIQRLVG